MQIVAIAFGMALTAKSEEFAQNVVNLQGNTNRLVLQGNNDFSTKKSFVLSGALADAIIKDNTYFVAPENTATIKGITKFVEQLN